MDIDGTFVQGGAKELFLETWLKIYKGIEFYFVCAIQTEQSHNQPRKKFIFQIQMKIKLINPINLWIAL